MGTVGRPVFETSNANLYSISASTSRKCGYPDPWRACKWRGEPLLLPPAFLIQPMLDAFTEETGIKVNIVFAKKGMFKDQSGWCQ